MRVISRWTDQERAVVAGAVASGDTHVARLLPLLPGRTKQHIWNMVQCAKREAAGKCVCGAPLPDRAARHSRCQACLDMARVRADARKAEGMCMRCSSRPADATLTYCSVCHQKSRETARMKHGSTRPGHDSSWGGLVRWRVGARPNRVLPHLLDEGWLLVDLFGGAANIATAVATCQKSRRVVYNDIHPTLCDIIEVARSGQVKDLVAMCDLFQHMTAEELLRRYRRRADLPPLVRAALLVTLSQSVKDRDFFKMEVSEVLPLPVAYSKRVRRLVPALSRLSVLNRDFAEVIAEYDSPRTLFFVDPPYPGTQFYEHNLTVERFAELAAQLNSIRGRFLMLTNSTRTSAEVCHTLPYNWWLLSHHGFTHNHLLVSTNYVVELPPVDLTRFGIGKQRLDAVVLNRAETPYFLSSIQV